MESESNTDKRQRLADEPFSYRVNKDKKVFLFWFGRQVMILSGKESEKFLSRIVGADTQQAQLIMAKITGNFKHGNERVASGGRELDD